MTLLTESKTIASLWMESVARAVLAGLDRVSPQRTVCFVEQPDGAFRLAQESKTVATDIVWAARSDDDGADIASEVAKLVRGKRIELLLRPDRFVVQPLELPAKAAEFVDGIVRSQIDRLTPWTPQQAAFGVTAPVAAGADRIAVSVAATARSALLPAIRTMTELGARSVRLSTQIQEAGDAVKTITVTDHTGTDDATLPWVRAALSGTLLAAAAATAVILAAAGVLNARWDAEAGDLAARIAARRTAIASGGEMRTGAGAALHALEQRKHTTPAQVMVIEALSRALPDDTYLTELRTNGSKLQIVGMTRNAPNLIPLIERSRSFDHATFFAATTQAPADSRERFHIEASIHPEFGAER